MAAIVEPPPGVDHSLIVEKPVVGGLEQRL